jgi:3-(3-hydroxy-phenyl)propionate hydroxylase
VSRVLVVGAGPVGLTMANLLGQAGLSVVVAERNRTTSDSPKAIGLDAEGMRTMQSIGLGDAVRDIVVPGTGTRYFGRAGQLLVHARGPRPFMFGHPFKNSFAQPDLEKVLLQGARRFPDVDVRFGCELTSLSDGADAATATFRFADGRDASEAFDYVLGCDGGQSRVRRSLGIAMAGQSHDDVWMVVDVLGDAHPQRFSMHHGRPERPTVIVPGLGSRCRYEFLLKPGEGTAGQTPPFELIARLCRPYRSIEKHEVERAVNYRFNSLVADEWRRGRVFLAGDAAHMMAPFGGQGLNSGLRDVNNLSWKLLEVLAGRADDRLLDSYVQERRPHAAAVVSYSRRLGEIVMTTSRRRAMVRDVAVRALLTVPQSRRYLEQMRFRPPQRITEGVVHPTGNKHARTLIGTIVPQPLVLPGTTLRPTRLDEVIGNGFALLGVDVQPSDWNALPMGDWPWSVASRHDVVLGDLSPWQDSLANGLADVDGALQADFQAFSRAFVLIRPDRIVASIFAPAQAHDVAATFRRFANPAPTLSGRWAPPSRRWAPAER